MLSIVFFYMLFVANEIYYIGAHLGGHFPLLILKVSMLFLCVSLAAAKLREGVIKLNHPDIIVIFLYTLTIFASAVYSVSPIYVLIYALLFIALQLFSIHIGYNIANNDYKKQLKTLNLILTVFIIISIIGYLLTYSPFFYFDVWGNRRVQGIYGEPSRLAQISGINILLSFFLIKKTIQKICIMTISFYGLFLAGNRSYMFAVIIISYLLFLSNSKITLYNKSFITVGIILCFFTVIFYPMILGERVQKYLRLESLQTLSGRTEMWHKTLPRALKQPFGAGYLLGGSVLVESTENKSILNKKNNFSLLGKTGDKSTLHNGYIQALCDVGPVGFILYIIIFLRGFFYAYKNFSFKDMRIYGCIFIFFSIVNLSATILVGPTTNNDLLFWVCWYAMAFNYNKSKISYSSKIHL